MMFCVSQLCSSEGKTTILVDCSLFLFAQPNACATNYLESGLCYLPSGAILKVLVALQIHYSVKGGWTLSKSCVICQTCLSWKVLLAACCKHLRINEILTLSDKVWRRTQMLLSLQIWEVCSMPVFNDDLLYFITIRIKGRGEVGSGKNGDIHCIPGHVLNGFFLTIWERNTGFSCFVFSKNHSISSDKCILCHYMRTYIGG